MSGPADGTSPKGKKQKAIERANIILKQAILLLNSKQRVCLFAFYHIIALVILCSAS